MQIGCILAAYVCIMKNKQKTLILSDKGELVVYHYNFPNGLYGKDGMYDWLFSLAWSPKSRGKVILDWNDQFVPSMRDVQLITKLSDNFWEELKKAEADYLEIEILKNI